MSAVICASALCHLLLSLAIIVSEEVCLICEAQCLHHYVNSLVFFEMQIYIWVWAWVNANTCVFSVAQCKKANSPFLPFNFSLAFANVCATAGSALPWIKMYHEQTTWKSNMSEMFTTHSRMKKEKTKMWWLFCSPNNIVVALVVDNL